MFLTKEQRDKLVECPTEEVTLDGREGWSFNGQDDEGRLEVKFNRYSLARNYERFVTVDGKVERYDAETDEYVEATFEPLEGQYFSRNPAEDEIRHTYHY